jgi:hypothetical protein
MTHTLLLELPEEVFESLANIARQSGQPPEALAVQWLIDATESQIDDPLDKIIGSIHTDELDWVDEHDKYIGLALSKDLYPSQEDND